MICLALIVVCLFTCPHCLSFVCLQGTNGFLVLAMTIYVNIVVVLTDDVIDAVIDINHGICGGIMVV